jgi:hypothetical protein
MGADGREARRPFLSAYAAACSNDFSFRSVQTMRPDTLIWSISTRLRIPAKAATYSNLIAATIPI